MDDLDTFTLRKRRDRLLNPITAPAAVLEAAMFHYAPPPPVPPAYHAVHLNLQGIPPAAFQGMADYFRVQQAARDGPPDDGQRNVRPRPANPPPPPPPQNAAPPANVPPGIPPAAFHGLANALFVQGARRQNARADANQRNVRPRPDPMNPPPPQNAANVPPGIPPAAFHGLANTLFVQGARREHARAIAEQRDYERGPAQGTRAQRQRVV
jgi:hypothetical protein